MNLCIGIGITFGKEISSEYAFLLLLEMALSFAEAKFSKYLLDILLFQVLDQ
jgi:hypothetical protein